MYYIGIDVGSKGAMTVLKDSKLHSTYEFKSVGLLGYIKALKSLSKEQCLLAIEKVHSMPKQGVASMFSFGQRLGELEGIANTLGIPYLLVPPQEWMKGIGIPNKASKEDIANYITTLFPTLPIRGKKGGLLDGISDSCCIAYYLSKRKPNE